MATKKKAAPKKAAKKTPAKKVAAKKTVKKVAPKGTGNKELDKMLKTLNKAKAKGEKTITVFTTNASHYDEGATQGFGSSDLKPKLLDAYKHLLINYNLSTTPVNITNKEIAWVVKF